MLPTPLTYKKGYFEMVKEKYYIEPINRYEAKEWVLKKHYAKSMPSLMHIFGLFDRDKVLNGVCGYGMPANFNNNNIGEYKVLELVRLVINEGHEKNVLSYFVSQCLKQLPRPMCIVSYADENYGHHGYIYQATNWLYTGISKSESTYFDVNTNKQIHPRTIVSTHGSRNIDSLPDNIIVGKESVGKHRYFMFVGNKIDVKNMKKYFKYPIYSYPKGNNTRYDASYIPEIQETLF